jgi:hypothetical protein
MTSDRRNPVPRGQLVAAALALIMLVAPSVTTSAGATASPATAIARALLNDAIVPTNAHQVHPSTAIVCQCAGTPDVAGLVTLHRYFVVAGPPTAVETFLTRHVPRGAHYDGSTGTSTTSNGNGIISITMTYPANGPHVYLRQLAYSMTRRNATTSWLRIDAQVVWIPSRTSAQSLTGVVAAAVTGYKNVGLMGSSGDVTIHVAGKKLATLVGAFNSLPLGPRNGCMESLNGFNITFSLKSGARLHVVNGFCAGSFDSLSPPAGALGGATYVLSDNSCTFFTYVTSLLQRSSVAGTRDALHQCETWAKGARS